MKRCIDCNKLRKPHMFAIGGYTCHDCVAAQMARISAPARTIARIGDDKTSREGREEAAFWAAQKAAGMGLNVEEL